MKQASAMPDLSQNSTRSVRRDAIARLTPLGWSRGLVLITALLAASFFVAGYFVVYWRNADMDFMVAYSALLLNDGQRTFFPHPAYFTILSVESWFRLLHFLNLLGTPSLSSMPSASAVPAFDSAMTDVIRAGRLVSWLTATILVLIFAGLARLFVQDWRIATLGTFAFAFSGGLQFHLRIMRSELIAGCLFAFALMILIIVGRQAKIWRPLAIGFAAMLCVLSLENKIHAILLIASLPVLLQPFGTSSSASVGFWDQNNFAAWLSTFMAAVLASALLYTATPLISLGLDPTANSAMGLRPLLLGKFGVYQFALLTAGVVGMLVFARIWRISITETLASMFAAAGGAALGILALLIEFDARNVTVVLNPLEEMVNFADASATSAVNGGKLLDALGLVLSGVLGVFQRYTFVLFSSPRPTVFLTWLIFPGIVYAWRRGEKQVAVQAALLMFWAIAIDALGIRRGLKAEYFILTDPLIIIAGLVLLCRLTDLRFHKWAYPLGVALVALHVGISQTEPVKLLTSRRSPTLICDWNQYYLPLLPVPWCDLPAKPPLPAKNP